ncbi:MarR family winged helix-turn-helix transcriptional regulator [Belliella kenyensis]|uniref:MarR family winged helix-turn-helix transcriptional regulator n=1 Tax=Belliella kenyensis TaxID=1472724 RepID=A0ABV8EPN8_9BACT|nr:MarR family transcriptional regulator [Belliella kenyensis]MCH7402593.1 MarR family transcriptional regulator [Belliella kenyensis]MDN3603391.1 MarR family transcriptional regulator [Belliella kenyensis]
MSKKDALLLENQICFPLYAASRMLIQAYHEPLGAIGLTYPQYLVMLVLWEEDGLAVNVIGKKLHLDSGTLTPLLKRLESSNLIKRVRSDKDERKVEIELTFQGKALKNKAGTIPEKLRQALNTIDLESLDRLKLQLHQLIDTLNQS